MYNGFFCRIIWSLENRSRIAAVCFFFSRYIYIYIYLPAVLHTIISNVQWGDLTYSYIRSPEANDLVFIHKYEEKKTIINIYALILNLYDVRSIWIIECTMPSTKKSTPSNSQFQSRNQLHLDISPHFLYIHVSFVYRNASLPVLSSSNLVFF